MYHTSLCDWCQYRINSEKPWCARYPRPAEREAKRRICGEFRPTINMYSGKTEFLEQLEYHWEYRKLYFEEKEKRIKYEKLAKQRWRVLNELKK